MNYTHIPHKHLKPTDKVIGLDLCKSTAIVTDELEALRETGKRLNALFNITPEKIEQALMEVREEA